MTETDPSGSRPESRTYRKTNSAIRAGDVTALETLFGQQGVKLRAIQLTSGVPQVDFGMTTIGSVSLAQLRTTQTLALSFHAQPNTLNLCVQGEGGGLMLEGKRRAANSLLIYSNPGPEAHWVGVVPKNETSRPAVKLVIPFSELEALGLPTDFEERGWLEVPLEPTLAESFVGWAEQRIFPVEGQPLSNDMTLDYWLGRLFSRVVDDGGVPRANLAAPGHYCHIVGLVENLLESNPNPGTLAVIDVADALGISVRTLQRAFRGVFDIGISRYLQHRRLKKARELILAGDDPISGVALRAGFRHTSRFAAQYRRLYGTAPSGTLRSA